MGKVEERFPAVSPRPFDATNDREKHDVATSNDNFICTDGSLSNAGITTTTMTHVRNGNTRDISPRYRRDEILGHRRARPIEPISPRLHFSPLQLNRANRNDKGSNSADTDDAISNGIPALSIAASFPSERGEMWDAENIPTRWDLLFRSSHRKQTFAVLLRFNGISGLSKFLKSQDIKVFRP